MVGGDGREQGGVTDICRAPVWAWLAVGCGVIGWSLPSLAYAADGYWRLGVGVIAFAAPASPGAAKSEGFIYPFPYAIYHSHELQLRHNRLQIGGWKNDPLHFGVSGSATPPAEGGTGARVNLGGLAPTFGIGPNVRYQLMRSSSQAFVVGVFAHYRFAVPENFQGIHTLGWSGGPFVAWHYGLARHIRLRVSAGPLWRTRTLNSYFFSAGTGAGAPYTARGGYAGARLTVSATHPWGRRYLLMVFTRIRDYHGAVFVTSPLLQRRDTVTVGVAFTVFFAGHVRSAG